MAFDLKEYKKSWYQAHKKEVKARSKAYRESHKEERKAWIEANKEEINAYHKEYLKDYVKADVNSFGDTKESIRKKSRRYLAKYGNKIPGYEIHHCCSYTEPYKFIYCSKEMHQLIHSYLRQHNIEADSDHYDLIKHLLDDTVVLYGIEL